MLNEMIYNTYYLVVLLQDKSKEDDIEWTLKFNKVRAQVNKTKIDLFTGYISVLNLFSFLCTYHFTLK